MTRKPQELRLSSYDAEMRGKQELQEKLEAAENRGNWLANRVRELELEEEVAEMKKQ